MIPFLHDDIQQLVKELLSLTIKSEIIDNYKENYKALLKIDLRDVRNHIKKKDMHVGFGTLDELQSLLRKDLISQADINKSRIEAREFLVTLLEKMFRKNRLSFNIVKYISFNIVKYMSVFDPKVLLNQAPSVCKSLFGKLVCALVGSKIISSSQGDKALSEFTSFHESSMSEKRLVFEKFNRHDQRLGEFFMKQTGIVSYTNVLPNLKLVLVLSHVQANVERCFNVNNNVLKCNMSEKSIMSQKLIIDHMKSHNLLPQSFPITKSLLQSVRSSRQRYEQYLREREESKCQNEKTEQWKILDKEIGAISDNRKISEKLNEEFLRLTAEAEKQRFPENQRTILKG